jgi:menaquinone-dependent protoporphyrinogen oxidase
MTVLVAYASAQGSSREIAEHVASRLAAKVGGAVCRSVEEVESVSAYEAVVIGSAIHNQAWLPAALLFFTKHTAELARRPVWVFNVGMADALPKPFRKRGQALQQARLAGALPQDLTIRGHKIFSGVYREAQMPAPLRLLFRLAGGRFGDLRDWAAIDAWADDISSGLRPSSTTTETFR